MQTCIARVNNGANNKIQFRQIRYFRTGKNDVGKNPSLRIDGRTKREQIRKAFLCRYRPLNLFKGTTPARAD